MNRSTKASDWEVVSVAQLGGAAGLGGGAFGFSFYSENVSSEASVFFLGGGAGIGGSAGGASIPFRSASEQARRIRKGNRLGPNPRRTGYDRINCLRPFSLSDLDYSFGNLISVGAALAVGFSLTQISAMNTDGSLFDGEVGVGAVAGVGAGVFNFFGLWRVI
ncbi:hypothetical protein BH24ACI3_BH24ACI3_00530 [soil metagenome]